MVIIRSNHPNLCCAPYLVLSLGYLNFSQPVGLNSLLQPVNESYQSVMLRTKRSVRPRSRNQRRDSFVHTCESINKLTAPFLSLCLTFLLFLSACRYVSLSICNTHLTGGSTSVHSNPSLIDTLWEEGRLALSALHWLYQGMSIWMLPCIETHELSCTPALLQLHNSRSVKFP